MFSNDKKKNKPSNTVKTSNTNKDSNSKMPSVNMITEGTTIEGTIDSKNDVRIAGHIKGEARSDTKLILTSSGHVDGDIYAVDADIAGEMEGEIRVSNKLILRKSAVIKKGDIYTKTLLVEEGAQIDGQFIMSSDPNINKKKKNSGSSNDNSNNKSNHYSGNGKGTSSDKKELSSKSSS